MRLIYIITIKHFMTAESEKTLTFLDLREKEEEFSQSHGATEENSKNFIFLSTINIEVKQCLFEQQLCVSPRSQRLCE